MNGQRQSVVSLAAVAVVAALLVVVMVGVLELAPRSEAERASGLSPFPASAPWRAASAPPGLPDFAALAGRVVSSVVSIFDTGLREPGGSRRGPPQDPFRYFYPSPDQKRREPGVRLAAGSGFFISTSGELLTNNHVVGSADRVEIELDDQSRLEAEVVGRDPEIDIVLLRVKRPDRQFPCLPLGRSSRVRIGEWVMAVGSPLGMDHTVTVGVVSATGRALGLSDDSSLESFIQTDAAINVGSSGGPLINLRGEVVAINAAVDMHGQNLGFAVPIDAVAAVLPQLRSHGKVVRGYLGVVVRDVDQRRQEAFGLASREGAFVEEVVAAHAGASAGLAPGDVIRSVDGVKIADAHGLVDEVSARSPGSRVELEVARGGTIRTVTVKLEERGAGGKAAGGREPEREEGEAAERAGLTVAMPSTHLRRLYRIPDRIVGVVVIEVRPLSAAADGGLLRGDVILEANGVSITTVKELLDSVAAVARGGYLRLYVLRPGSGQSFFVILELGE